MSPEILSYVTQNFTMCNTQRRNDGKLQKKKKIERWFSLDHLYKNKLKGQNERSFQFAQLYW